MKIKSYLYLPLLLLFTVLYTLTFQGCRDDEILDDPYLELSFSADTVLFDTVFTTVGSATKHLKVYNKHDRRIRISSIEIGGGNASHFRINTDGEPGDRVEDIEIGANDSIYIFAEVTIDPVDDNLPYVIEDSIIFRTNQNEQSLKLVAWGQNANFIRPNAIVVFGKDTLICHYIDKNTTWSSELPYVVYGLVMVDENTTLTIEEGANIHMHNNSSLIFLPGSTFKVLGTIEDQVTIEGSRLERRYRERAGQWNRIWMMATSRDHEIRNAIIKNGTVGLHIDSIGSHTDPTLILENTFIRNMSNTGILAQGSHITGENVVVSNCGEFVAVFQLGGKYDFRHSTFANYYDINLRQTPSLLLNNYYEDVDGNIHVRDLTKAYFGNSIIYGSLEDEIKYNFYDGNGKANYTFDHSILKTTMDVSATNYKEVLVNHNPQFHDISGNDYRLTENSPAIDAGDPQISQDILYDILDNSRQERSDIGAYQYYDITEEEEEGDN